MKVSLPIADIPRYDPQKPRPRFFTVVWCGDYRFAKFAEGDGSHPGIDLDCTKYRAGQTPIFAVLPGEVVKIGKLQTGFGLHVVIRHPKAPSPDAPNRTETLFSSYCHLSQIDVKIGQKVRAGEQIGISGTSGNSTAPHLHFQIDRETAPYHPFWPFTRAEQIAAKFDFVSAINAGLGIAKTRKFTVSPLTYLQRIGVFPAGFTDVENEHPHLQAIAWAHENGVVTGHPDGSFRPDVPVTRVEFLKIIFGVLGIVPKKVSGKSEWFAPIVAEAKRRGVAYGYPDGEFRPHQTVVRSEAFAMLVRTAEIETNEPTRAPFPDVPPEAWFALPASAAKKRRLLRFGEFFEPFRDVTRGEACEIAYRSRRLKK